LRDLDRRIASDTSMRGKRASHAFGDRRAPDEPIAAGPPHPAALPLDELRKQVELTRGRTGGPGGQHRNKVETAVELRHAPTDVGAHASERRSVGENLRVAIARLRLNLAVRVRCPVPEGDARSELWKSRVPETGANAGRIIVSPRHHDFPSMLAEALDVLHACGHEHKRAAARLACTPSQLVRFLKDHPPAIAWVNSVRVARGLHGLK